MQVNKQELELPGGYTRASYLESNGKQYIRTQLNKNEIFSYEINFCTTNIQKYNPLAGLQDANGIRIIPLAILAGGKVRYGFGKWYDISNVTIKQGVFYHLKSDFANGFQKIYINDALIASSSGTISMPNTEPYLFLNNYSNIVDFSWLKIQLCCIKNTSSEIVRNFIPAIDKNGKPCMYDTVTRQPFYNQGSGEFGYELLDGTYVAPV